MRGTTRATPDSATLGATGPTRPLPQGTIDTSRRPCIRTTTRQLYFVDKHRWVLHKCYDDTSGQHKWHILTTTRSSYLALPW